MARPGPRAGRAGARPADETRARIVEAALATLHEEGIMGASARAIARRGDFNQALIFYHFGGVNELLLAALDELSARRVERYERRLEQVDSLRELVAIAGELHAEDLEEGHITVLSQMLAGATTNPELRAPLRERFEPWVAMIERSVTRALGDTPYARFVPTRDLAVAVTSLFIGLELVLNIEEEDDQREHRIFRTLELLAGLLEGMLDTLTPPPVAPPETNSE